MMRSRLFSIIYMFGLTFFFTAAVSVIYSFNERRIEINEQVKLQKVILHVLDIHVLPKTTDEQIREIFEKRVERETADGKTLYRGFAEDGKTLLGYAFPLFGPGFWGPVYGMIGVDPQLNEVLGIRFYQHEETPGLGGRITEPWFEKQFEGKRLHPGEENGKYFVLVPPGMADTPNEVDAITGATGTSRAVERLINKSLKEYLPWIAERRAESSSRSPRSDSVMQDGFYGHV